MEDTGPKLLALIRHLERHTRLAAPDRLALDGLRCEARSVPALRCLAWCGEKADQVHVILSGWCCSYRFTAAGRRHVIAHHLPGEIPDILALDLSVRDANITTVGPCTFATLPIAEAVSLRDASQGLAEAFRREAAIQAALARSRAGQAGRPEEARLAHFLCEMRDRLAIAGPSQGDRLRLPFGREGIPEAVGLPPDASARALATLERGGFIAWQRREVAILDLPGLSAVADYDPVHLHLRQPAEAPRPRPSFDGSGRPALRLVVGGSSP